jgi:DNA-binding response OmpR family regulator
MARLLLVDDEQDLLEALKLILSLAGYQVHVVTSAQAGLKVLHTPDDGVPDLIITDVAMPEMSGLQFLEEVRAQPDWANMPFLFISATITPELKRQIDRLDRVTLLCKPFGAKELYAALDAVCPKS